MDQEKQKVVKSFYPLQHKIFDLCVTFIRTIKGIITDKNARAILYMKVFDSGRVHQTTAATCLNRYPDIFSACKEYFRGKDEIRILSFGCSTGEEVITLQRYFPRAEIVGAEINKNSLAVCRKLNLGEKIHFIDSVPREIESCGPFDAIFCMAVFQRTPGLISEKEITDLKKIYPFEKFEQQIIELDQYLNVNGLLVIHMSQYDFPDTVIASKYQAFGDYNQNYYGRFVFDRDSKIKKEIKQRNSIFMKVK